jgi:hypothetical protein
VLPRFSAPLALDVSTLHQLGVAALLLFAWGAVVLTTRPAAWSRALRILAACNMAYLLLTWVLLMRLPARPALLALAYFAGEALVVGVLAAAEWRYARRHEGREFLR